jgi:hypothetical protein
MNTEKESIIRQDFTLLGPVLLVALFSLPVDHTPQVFSLILNHQRSSNSLNLS